MSNEKAWTLLFFIVWLTAALSAYSLATGIPFAALVANMLGGF